MIHKLEPVTLTALIVYPLALIASVALIARWSRKGSSHLLDAFGGPVRYGLLLAAGTLVALGIYESFRRGLLLVAATLLTLSIAIPMAVAIRAGREKERNANTPSKEGQFPQ